MAALPLVLAGCGADSNGSANGARGPSLDRGPVLESIADRVVQPALQEVSARATALVSAAETARTQDGRQVLQDAWLSFMEAWQAVEMMRFGPVGDRGGPPAGAPRGGQGIGEQVYSWPDLPVNPCAVDQATVKDDFAAPGYFDSKLPNVYGLGALEYLAFVEEPASVQDLDNACAERVDINADGIWDDRRSEVPDLRAAFAVAQARHIESQVSDLVSAWSEGFRDAFVGAGTDTSVFPSAQEAFDDLYAAMNRFDLWVKDDKLGIPLGIHAECLEDACPDEAESPWADASRRFLAVNARAFRRLFLGGEPDDPNRYGFDSYLRDLDQGALADELVERIDAVVATAEDTEPAMRQALMSDAESLRTLHAAINQLTRTLKSQFVSVLALEVPREGAADND